MPLPCARTIPTRLPLCGLALVLSIAVSASRAIGAEAGERLAGPVAADVVEIVDGDSLKVSARIWPGQRVLVNIRLRGIDAPEMHAACPAERRMAMAAKETLRTLVGSGPVGLVNIGGGKYYGRMLADIRLADGSDLAARLLRAAPVRPYRGGHRAGWCG